MFVKAAEFAKNLWIKIQKQKLIKSLFITVLLSSCLTEPEPTLSIGGNAWLGNETIFLASKLGFYDNSNIKLVGLPSATSVIHALKNGALNGAMLTLDEALTVIDDGYNLKVILVIDYSNGADALLSKPEFKSLHDLRGKRIAVEYTAVGALMLDSAIKAAQIELSEITLVGCDIDSHIQCYIDSDAIITFDPVRTNLINQGANVLFDSSKVPGLILDVLVIDESVIRSHQQSLKKLVEGYFKARDYLISNQKSAMNIIGERLQLTESEVIEAYHGVKLLDLQENYSYLNTNNSRLEKKANQLLKIMFDKKLVVNKSHISDLTDKQFLPELFK